MIPSPAGVCWFISQLRTALYFRLFPYYGEQGLYDLLAKPMCHCLATFCIIARGWLGLFFFFFNPQIPSSFGCKFYWPSTASRIYYDYRVINIFLLYFERFFFYLPGGRGELIINRRCFFYKVGRSLFCGVRKNLMNSKAPV